MRNEKISGEMHSNHTHTIGVCGLGLIGGSLAKALRVAFPQTRIIAADCEGKTLRHAVADSCANETILAAPDDGGAFLRAFDGCDFLFLCAPPPIVAEQLAGLKDVKVGVITDVASVKIPIMKAAANLPNFIGGHPMAGSEGAGYEASDAALFKGASYIISGHSAGLESLITAIGARPIIMDAESHDRRMAFISHLPHIAAFALAASPVLRDDPLTRSLIGGGFRDTTRIAASAPSLWSDIFTESKFLPSAIDDYIEELRALKTLISSGDKNALIEHLRVVSDFRRKIPEGLKTKTNNLPKENEKEQKKE